jgi:hypothetical protein
VVSVGASTLEEEDFQVISKYELNRLVKDYIEELSKNRPLM